MSGLLDKLQDKIRSVSKDRTAGERGRTEGGAHHSHLNPDYADKPRSESRGRTQVHASGRGGAGNMSTSRARAGDDESAADIAKARGVSKDRSHATGAGRGGAGNIHVPTDGSQERAKADDAEEAAVRAAYEAKHAGESAAHGRGGFGNIAKSPVRGADPKYSKD